MFPIQYARNSSELTVALFLKPPVLELIMARERGRPVEYIPRRLRPAKSVQRSLEL